MQKSYFDNYIQSLKKLEQKRFQKVLDLYTKKLRPLAHAEVKKQIENNKKLSDVVKSQMLQFNDYILERMFTSKEFIKECRGFKIGDEIFVDDSKNKRIIAEFIETDEGTFVIFTNHSIINPPIMIEMISKEKRPNSNGKPYFAKLKEHSIFDDLHIKEITSDINSMLYEFAAGSYDFNPVYQRDLVWTTEKKQAFIKKLIIGDIDLCPTLIMPQFKEGRGDLEVLDCKQRMMAGIQFIQGQFPFEGFYYKDLSSGDVSRLMNAPFKYKQVKYYDKNGLSEMTLQQKVELFLQVNEYGQKVSDEHLAKIKKEFIHD